MFNLQAFVFLTVLYAVNAAMVVSIYDDGFSEKRNIKDCNYGECDQLCRRIGFPGGACVGDRCKCDVIQEITTIQELKDCNSVNCYQLCRRMGFIGGDCVNNHCRCDTYLKFKEMPTKSDVVECYFPDCNNDCMHRGYDGGYCWGDRCKCVTYNKSNEDVEFQTSKKEINSCYNGQCDEICRRLGFISGGCSKGHCRCRITSQVDDEIINMEKNFYDVLSNNKIDECSSYSCKMTCQVEGHLGGSCVNDRCICRKKESKPHLNMLGDCNNACNNFCISKNWSGGFCIGQICFCY